MNITSLSALAVLAATLDPAFGQTSGVTINNIHRMTGAGISERFGSRFYAFAEGNNLTSTTPVSSISFSGPGTTGNLAFNDGRWRFQDDRIGLVNPTTTHFRMGAYTFNAGGNLTPLDLTGSFPNVPLVLSASAGRWQDGVLILTADEAKSPLILATNSSNGNGFVTFEMETVTNYDPGYNGNIYADEDIEDSTNFSSEASTIEIQGDAMKPGLHYIGELEYDNVLDFKDANGIGGTAFALAGSTTLVTIQVQNEVLESQFIWTGPKEGQVNITTEEGFRYDLKRSVNLSFGVEEPIVTFIGDGSPASLPFDDSASTDVKAFFRVEREQISTAPDAAGFASLIGGKTYRGFTYTTNNRWSAFRLGGNWSYSSTGAQTADLVLTYDDLNNDPSQERDVYSLDFGSDGNSSTVEVTQIFYENDVSDGFVINYTLDLGSNSFAPPTDILEDLLVGNSRLGYVFTSSTRFIFGFDESGNWSYTFPNDDSITLTFTYDQDDNNNPAIYREEIDLNFNGTKNVPFQYREYEFDSLTNSNRGTVELLLD